MNSIVKQIHGAFEAGEEQIVKEAKQILQAAENQDNLPKIQKLKGLGFNQIKNITELDESEQLRAKELLHYKELYDEIAPNYKFITDSKRIEICKRWGIVMANVDRFIGRIPQKNIDHIANFKILDNSYIVEQKDSGRYEVPWGNKILRDLSNRHLLNVIHYIVSDPRIDYIMDSSRKSQFNRAIYLALSRGLVSLKKDEYEDKTHFFYSKGLKIRVNMREVNKEADPEQDGIQIKPKFYIISDIEQLDQTKALLDEEKMYLSHEKWLDAREEQLRRELMRHPDPIVLAEVQGGFLIVTAWGDEASDSEIIHPKSN